MDDTPLLTLKEVAAILRKSENQIGYMYHHDQIPRELFHKMGKRVYVYRRKFEAWVNGDPKTP